MPTEYFIRKGFDENKTLTRIRNSIVNDIDCISNRLYLISNYDEGKWDYPRLRNDLVEGTPVLKQRAMVMSISANTKLIIEKKVQEMKAILAKLQDYQLWLIQFQYLE